MTNSTYQQEKETAIAAVREAALLCQAVQAEISPAVLEKKDRSPVTVADYGSQALVCRYIKEVYPEDPIIGEEDAAALRKPENTMLLDKVVRRVGALRPGANAETVCRWIDQGGAQSYSSRFWTLDPIDGTKGFLRSEQYAIALALIIDGQVTVAAMACPNLPVKAGSEERGVVYSAILGEGVEAHALTVDEAAFPVQVSTLENTSEARFCESVEAGHSSHSDAAKVAELLKINEAPVRLDSQAKYAVVARGEADIYMRLPTRPGYVEKIWDHAAGMLVVTEAGGTATDVYGNPLSFDQGSRLEKNRGVIVSNGQLHDAVLDALKTVGVARPVS